MDAVKQLNIIFNFLYWSSFVLCQKTINIQHTAGQILQTTFLSIEHTTIYCFLLFHLQWGTTVTQRKPGGYKPKNSQSSDLKIEAIPLLNISPSAQRRGHAVAVQRNVSALV